MKNSKVSDSKVFDLKVFDLKVFKMNECDWVVAKSMLDAIKWYEEYYELDWVEDTLDIDPKECNIDETILYNPDIYNEPDRRDETTFRKLIATYTEMYPNDRPPYIIVSTEY